MHAWKFIGVSFIGCCAAAVAIGACGDTPGSSGGGAASPQACDTKAACLDGGECCFASPDAATGVCQEKCVCLEDSDCVDPQLPGHIPICCSGACVVTLHGCVNGAGCEPGFFCAKEEGNDCFGYCEPEPGSGGGGGTGGGGGSTTTIVEGDFATLDQPEAPSILDYISFQIVIAAFEDDNYVVVAGSQGQRVHRLSDGSVTHDFTVMNAPSYASVGANNALVSIGPEGYAIRGYDLSNDTFSAFQQLGAIGFNITGLAPIPTSNGVSVHGMFYANNSNNLVRRLDANPGPFGGFSSSTWEGISATDFASKGIAGDVVHVYSPVGEGPILGVSELANTFTGRLWWLDPATLSSLDLVGLVGDGPRRIDCLEPAGTPCAISNYVSGTLTLLDWPDRNAAPTIGATSVPVAGPVGIDMALVNGAPTVVSTGFNDNTVHLTTIGPGLTPSDEAFTLVGCSQPGHAIFLPNATHILVTCFGSDIYQVHALPLTL
jgi:hypothetical protein